MSLDYKIGQLRSVDDWAALGVLLGGGHLRVVRSIIQHLMVANVSSYLCETRYIDRDYSSDYRTFYAQTFKTYDRHCQRVHFFAEDVEALCAEPNWTKKVQGLQRTSLRSYRGFCVVRPLAGAPIGRTVLYATGPAAAGLESVVTCRATFRTNLLGAELDVVGSAFMQQDSRVGACAQVAIWAGARHMHRRYGYDWFSVADITKLAAPSTSDEATSLPAGSDFLTSERMIRAIVEMGFQPLCLEGPHIGQTILPYVESGVPVILGLQHGTGLGHAVTVLGRVFAGPKKPTNKPIDYVAAYIVHDDQAGPYMLVPMNRHSAQEFGFDQDQVVTLRTPAGSVSLDVDQHGGFAIVLMPACDSLKSKLLKMHLPHFTWVTEISTIGSYNQVSAGLRRMYGHAVVDATSSGKDAAALLMLHIPGLVSLRDVDAEQGRSQESAIVIQDDALYESREKRIDH